MRMRALRSNVSRTSCFSSTWSVEVRRDEVGELARLGDAVDERAGLLGSSGISWMTRLAMSFRFIASASTSTSVAVGSATRWTLRREERLAAVERRAPRMRETPCRMTQKLSFASLMTLRMRAAQPTV